MFQRGNDAFNQKIQENTTLKDLRTFYLSKDQSGNYVPKSILHLHGANEAVVVKIHEIKVPQPDGRDKYVQALCMNQLDKPCPCCISGMYSSTVAIYKIYDFTQYTSKQDNQTKQVGVRPMFAKKTQQAHISSLASADPSSLRGRVVTYHRSGHNGKDWNVQLCQQQMNDQQLIQFQNFMKGYSNEEIIEMIPVSDEKSLNDLLAVVQRGGAGTANSNFNPNQFQNNGGGQFNPNQTFNNNGGQHNNGNMNFSPNGGGNNPQNNGGGQPSNDMNFNPNGGGQQNFQTETHVSGHNTNAPDQNFNPERGGSVGNQDPSLGGGQGHFANNEPSFDADDIPF